MAKAKDQWALVPSDCEPSRVPDLLDDLRARVDAATPSRPLRLDLTDGRPTALALQLVAAAALTLTRRDAFGGFGKNAATILHPATDA